MWMVEPLMLLVGVCLVTSVAADAGDDFSNNLFSDLAPLLALFGERVTTQFMSQSTGWADNVILAMAPLGVLTAIVGAIRVGGPSWLKAIIGRARESRAIAESELMSSTSKEVCELWNGQGIVRVMGEGQIREFIVLLPEGSGEKGGGAETTKCPGQPPAAIGTEGDSAGDNMNDLKAAQEVLVTELKGLEDKDTKYLKRHDLSGRERILGKLTPDCPGGGKDRGVHQPNATFRSASTIITRVSGNRDQQQQDTEKALPDSDAPELRQESSFEKPNESRPSVIVIRNSNTPNLTLNLHNQIGRGELYMVAACGIVLQFGVLAYSGIAAKYLTFDLVKDGSPVADYAFPCTAAGTVLLVLGMLICAHVVESSTSETRYRPPAGKSARVVWLQRSGTVNDQVFESFAIFPDQAQALVTTSRRRVARLMVQDLWPGTCFGRPQESSKGRKQFEETEETESNQIKKSVSGQPKDTILERLLETEFEEVKAVAGTIISICGFIVQFVGLRGMHWSVSIAQLGATVVMTILRAWVRRNLAKNPGSQPLLSGYEIDWLAMTLGGDCRKAPWMYSDITERNWDKYDRPWAYDNGWDWRVAAIADPTKVKEFEELKPPLDAAGAGTEKLSKSPQASDNGNDGTAQTLGPALKDEASSSRSNAHKVMMMRRSLSKVADWHGPASAEAISLARAIEIAMEGLLPTLTGSFTWSLEVSDEPIYFRLERGQAGAWKAYSDEIDAALSLWLYSVDNKEQGNGKQPQEDDGKTTGKQEEGKNTIPAGHKDAAADDDAWLRATGTQAKRSLRLLGRTTTLHQDLQWWMPDGAVRVIKVEQQESANISSTIAVQAHRIVGYASDLMFRADLSFAGDVDELSTHSILAAESYVPLKTLFAQHMFSAFMWAAAKTMKERFPGRADIRPTEADSASGRVWWQSFALHNPRLSKMVEDIQSTGLGSLEDIYLSVIPPLSTEKRLPRADAIVERTQEHAKPQERLGHWKEAAGAYLWLFRTAKVLRQDDITTKATALLMECLRAVIDATKLRKAQQFEERDIDELEKLQSELHDELRNGDVDDTLECLMGLYKVQGRSWESSLVTNPKHFEGEEATVKFRRSHWMAHRNDSWDIKQWLEDKEGRGQEKDVLDWTPLHYAAAKLSVHALEELLACRADVNARDIRGRTPLHYACQHNDARLVQSLLRDGAEVNMQDVDGMAPMHHAATYGCSAVVQSLIEAGADVNLVDALGNTPLLWAVYKGHRALIKDLLGDSKTRLRDHNGRTALHLAAIAEGDVQGRNAIVELLLGLDTSNNGSDRIPGIDPKDRGAQTPLHLAARRGNKEVVSLLLDEGAEIEAKDGVEKTPLHWAAEGGAKEVVSLLLHRRADIEAKAGNGSTPLHLAAARGKKEVVSLLLDRHADIEAKDMVGRTPLHLAAERDEKEVVSLLLHRRAEIEAKDGDGRTPLHLAAIWGKKEVVSLLLDRAADIEAKDWKERTPLHLAAARGEKEVVSLLLDRAADIEAKDRGGRTPLHLAAERGKKEVVSLLLDKAADIEAKDGGGRTPLHLAAEWGEKEVVSLLLDRAADIEAKDRGGRTPLHLAAERGKKEIVSLLLDKAADIEAKDGVGKAPLHWAAARGEREVVSLLLDRGAEKGEGWVL